MILNWQSEKQGELINYIVITLREEIIMPYAENPIRHPKQEIFIS